MAQLSIGQATSLLTRALQIAGASDAMANSTPRALVLAESQGLASHGLSRVPRYAARPLCSTSVMAPMAPPESAT